MSDIEKIYLDEEGYNQHLKEIERLKALLSSNNREKSSAYVNAVGDGWHDNFAFEQAKRDEYKIMCDLQRKIEELNRIVVIEKTHDASSVDIGDYIVVCVNYGEGDLEDETFRLTGSETPNFDLEIPEVTVNSPLGKTVYQHEVGYKGEYTVQSRVFKVEIKKIAKSLDDLTFDDDNVKVR